MILTNSINNSISDNVSIKTTDAPSLTTKEKERPTAATDLNAQMSKATCCCEAFTAMPR